MLVMRSAVGEDQVFRFHSGELDGGGPVAPASV